MSGIKRILLIEDDELVSKAVMLALTDKGDVRHCGTLEEAFASLASAPKAPALVILDLRLPDGDGLDVLDYLRRAPRFRAVPVLVLTGRREFFSKKCAFDKGGDVYLTKPVNYKELVLWVDSLLRRPRILKQLTDGVIASGDLTINPQNCEVSYKGRKVRGLTDRQISLLYSLVKHAPRIFSRREIIQDIWKTFVVENAVDVQLSGLRGKLPLEVSVRIVAKRGEGFRYMPAE